MSKSTTKLDRQIERVLNAAIQAAAKTQRQQRRGPLHCQKCGAELVATSRQFALCPRCPAAKLIAR